MSGLFVDSIKDASNTKTLATLSSSAVTLDSSVVFPAGGTGNPVSVAVIADEKSTDTNSGGSAADTTQYRDLNTKLSDLDNIVTVDPVNKQFTIGAGTYLIECSAPAYKVNRHHVLLWDQTAGAYVTKNAGTSEYTSDSDAVATRSFGSYIVTPTSSNVYRIAHYTASAQTSNGLGIEVEKSGLVSIFTIVKIIKLK